MWENFRNGLVIGTREFVDTIRSKYFSDECHNDVPHHRAVARSNDPVKILEKALSIVKVDFDLIQSAGRVPNAIKEDRDLLIYLLHQTCLLSNKEAGSFFGVTYSAVSRVLNAMRSRLKKEPELLKNYNHI